MTITPTTAVVLIPPEPLWAPIQAIRRVHDRHAGRWMPHVTLLYPFRPITEWDAVDAGLRAACASIGPFAIVLARFRHFSHSPRAFTLWLDPEPAGAVARLQAALQAACPECDAQSRHPSGFTPHLSVGQARDADQLQSLRGSFQSGWAPIRFEVTAVSLIARPEDGPFEERLRIPLG